MRTKSSKKYYCRFCNQDISSKPSNRRNFCNSDCHNQWQRIYSVLRKRVVLICKWCKKSFESKPFEKRVFCSRECMYKWNSEDKKINHCHHTKASKEKISKSLKGKFTGEKSSFYVSGKQIKPKIEKICPICKKTFLTEGWMHKKFCSLYCSRKRLGQGGYREGSVTNFNSGWYESPIAGKVWLDSSYEFIMAKYLDEKKYQWTKNKIGFDYLWKDGKIHLYFPDFYITNLNIWVETKGYMVERDTWKWYFFPNDLRVITKKKIFNPEIWGF